MGALMRTRARIYFRTLRFVSMNWFAPFLMGIAVSLALVTYAETEVLKLLGEAFDQSIQTVIQSCAQ
jgi:hypothetical protein